MSKLQAQNQTIIGAPVGRIWNLVTDINMLTQINPGVLSATGRMDKLNETRTCEIDNRGRKGTMTEKLVELVPEAKTVWTIESDTMGMGKMLRDTRFVFELEKLGENSTKVTSSTYYQPANIMAAIMNSLMMKKMIGKAQAQILENLERIATNKK